MLVGPDCRETGGDALRVRPPVREGGCNRRPGDLPAILAGEAGTRISTSYVGIAYRAT